MNVVKYSKSGIYIDSFRTTSGCDSIRFLSLEAKYGFCCAPYVPNAFSPNADNINDEYKVVGAFDDYEINIADRWGKIVFTGTNALIGWDGKYKSEELPVGTYFFFLKYKCAGSETILLKGDILLIR